MKKERKTSINIALSILKQLMEGKHLKVGDQTLVMANDGCVGYVLDIHGGVVTEDLTIRELAELVEEYEISRA